VSGDVETMEHGVTRLEHGIAEVRSIVNRLEAKAVRLVEDLIGRQLGEAPAVAAIWSDPLVRGAGVTLADVVTGGRLDSTPAPAAPADPVDSQAAFVRLAEQVGSYQVAAREHPAAWAAYRDAADLNGAS
jgi:hypothetical protein